MLPTFLIIGAMKAGTTSLWKYLRLHPEVHLPDIKELNFFNEERNWSLGWSWYASQFESQSDGTRAYGEASTNYTKYPAFSGVAEKIAAALPQIKLIYLVRDPVERIRSMYVHMLHQGEEDRSFDEAMSDLSNNHYVQLSLYHFQLTQYLSHFDKNQILVIASEDLLKKRVETLQRVFQFIGVTDRFESSDFENTFHKSTELRKMKPFAKVLRKLPLPASIGRHLPVQVRTMITNVMQRGYAKPVIKADLRRRLTEVLKPDVDALQNLIGQRFDFWLV